MIEKGEATSRLENRHRLIIELRPREMHTEPGAFSPPPMSTGELERSKIKQSEPLESPPRTEDQFTSPLVAANMVPMVVPAVYYTAPPMSRPAFRSSENARESASADAVVEPAGNLRIAVLEGDEAINNIKQRVSRPPTVEVQRSRSKACGWSDRYVRDAGFWPQRSLRGRRQTARSSYQSSRSSLWTLPQHGPAISISFQAQGDGWINSHSAPDGNNSRHCGNDNERKGNGCIRHSVRGAQPEY
jgi:hypothetical protein